jgi:exosortase A-associated hydrolase 1
LSGTEYPLRFDRAGVPLVGIVHPAGKPAGDIGVVVVVGGPQYRVGSHRQFVLLARDLAAAGIPTLRFDTRGMGDSGGDFPGFEAIDDDLAAAIDALQSAEPSARRIVLWGLCDGASAIMFYGHRDPRVAGIALANPWVRTEEGYSQTQLRHYYLERFFSYDFWRRLASGKVDLDNALRSFLATLKKALGGRVRGATDATAAAVTIDPSAPLPDRMAQGLAAFGGASLLIISGRDLTAREFEDVAARSAPWRRLLAQPSVTRRDLAEADHTMSQRRWADAAAAWTAEWIKTIGGGTDVPASKSQRDG